MRAAVHSAVGEPMTIERVARPLPAFGEALVRVAACGVCHTDLHVLKGEVAFPHPCVLGHEVSGTVVACGRDTDGPAPGTRVVGAFVMPCGTCRHCARGRDDLCTRFFELNRLRGVLYDGTTRLARDDGTPLAMYSMAGLAEYAVVPVLALHTLPDSLPLEESAIIGCALFTAYGAVRHAADLRAGETVAVIGVGGVGSNVIQVARAFGAARVIAVDVSAAKLELARSLGATHTVDATEGDVVAAVRAHAGGEGVDVAFEALGRAETFIQATEVLADGGRMIAVGIAAAGTTAPAEITRMVRRSLRVIGSYGARTREDLPVIVGMVERGVVSPARVVSERFGLDEAAAAYDKLDRGEITGRALVIPDPGGVGA
jgi:S-(hydroxymethyl)glutathione dehydrogenase/alcohol dehydrogenase